MLQAIFILGVIAWLVLVRIYYRHRAEQYWYKHIIISRIPRSVRDELYKVNPLRTEADNHNRSLLRVLFHRHAFYEAIDKPEGERGNITFTKQNKAPYLFTCEFKAFRSVVRGTHERDEHLMGMSLNGVTGLLSKIYGDLFKMVLKGKLYFYQNKKGEIRKDSYFMFTGDDVPPDNRWSPANCDIHFLERIGMLVLFSKGNKKGFGFFFRCLPFTFAYYRKGGCGNKCTLRFNTRLFVNILIFYGWDVKFYKDYKACISARQE
ncbi:hypothetical protein KAU45_03845 [bacterium]|nr:hypothetical protein [bacterium]